MTEPPGELMPTPSRSKRLYVYWGIALALLLTLGLVCWKVVVPVMEARSLVHGVHEELAKRVRPGDPRFVTVGGFFEESVKRLGGPDELVPHLRLYNRLPSWVAGRKYVSIRLLSACGDKGTPGLIEAMEAEPHEAVRALVKRGPAAKNAVPVLAKIVAAPYDETFLRGNAARALGNIGPDAAAAVPVLNRLAQCDVPPDQQAAITALGKIGPSAKSTLPTLVKALRQESAVIRLEAAKALGRIADSRAIEPLQEASKDSSALVRRAAAEALKKIRASEGEQFGGWIRDEGLPVTPGTPAATRYVLPKWVDSLPRRLITCPVGASVDEVYKHLGRTRLHRLSTGNPLPGPSPKTMTQEYELVELSEDGLKYRHRYNLVIMWTIVGKELRFKSGRLVRASITR